MKRALLSCALLAEFFFASVAFSQQHPQAASEKRLLSPVLPSISLEDLNTIPRKAEQPQPPAASVSRQSEFPSRSKFPEGWPPATPEKGMGESSLSPQNGAPTFLKGWEATPRAERPALQAPVTQRNNSESSYIQDVRKRAREFEKEETFRDKMHLSFGAGLGYRPKFEGADSYQAWPIPVIDVSYADTFFINTFRGMGYNLFNSEDFKAGPLMAFDWGRDSGDATYLRGFKDIKPTLESGFFLDKKLTKYVGLNWDLRNDFLNRGHEGITSAIGLDARLPITQQITGNFGVKTTWASTGYMKSYFGVDRVQSTNSGLPLYKPAAGFKDVGGDAGVSYNINEHLAIALSVGLKNLIGDAANSPITQRGSEMQWFGGSYVVYTF